MSSDATKYIFNDLNALPLLIRYPVKTIFFKTQPSIHLYVFRCRFEVEKCQIGKSFIYYDDLIISYAFCDTVRDKSHFIPKFLTLTASTVYFYWKWRFSFIGTGTPHFGIKWQGLVLKIVLERPECVKIKKYRRLGAI